MGLRGVEGDREFLLVDQNGLFITQREMPQLSQILVEVDDRKVIFHHKGKSFVASIDTPGPRIPVRIWKSDLLAPLMNEEINAWLSDVLDTNVYLVRYDNGINRIKKVPLLELELPVMFPDGYPVSIISQATIKDISHRLDMPIDPLRFRANIIIDGVPPYGEDNIDRIKGKDFSLRIVKKIARCQIPNINPSNGIRDANVLRELAAFRKDQNNIFVGVHAYVTKQGEAFVNEDLSISFK